MRFIPTWATVVILSCSAFAQSAIMPPALIGPHRKPVTNYFFATAIKDGWESLPSNQVSTTNNQCVLDWDYPESDLPFIKGFRMYYGRSSSPTSYVSLGTNLSVLWPYLPPRTNVITLSTPAFHLSFTNPPGAGVFRAVLQRSDSPLGPWTNIADIPRAINIVSYQ